MPADALGVLDRVTLCCHDPDLTSMNGVTLHTQSLLADAGPANAVIVGSGNCQQPSFPGTLIP
jgi:hypothetical protein